MPRVENKLKRDQIAITCDKCGMLISGDDDGFLCTIGGREGTRRWRAFHDGCDTRAPNRLGGYPRRESIVVRASRVNTYSLLLTTLADLATDPRIDFAKTAWPALLQRLAFDTEWERNGRRSFVDLEAENRSALLSAGLWNRSGAPVSAQEIERDRERERKAYEDDRRKTKQENAIG